MLDGNNSTPYAQMITWKTPNGFKKLIFPRRMNAQLAIVVLFIAVTSAVPLPDGEARSGFYCHVCTDAVGNNDCNNTELCDSANSVCQTTLVYDDSAVSIEKRCARKQVCYNMEENNEDGCYNADDEFDGVCSFCCTRPGCNEFIPIFKKDAATANLRKAGGNTRSKRTSRPKPTSRAKPTSRPKSHRSNSRSKPTSRPKGNSRTKQTTRAARGSTTTRATRPPATNPAATNPPATKPAATRMLIQ
ncbi:hypothetical protein RRG08_038845 [Elysia crispata]|uniref:Uncharacterized protein n=1 Tax=Elysia crispata TaxID=231223 RepID=A0AAE0YTR7_9GAST|nr:hypothetical protein RRG08_038845 [Elysia crispata]